MYYTSHHHSSYITKPCRLYACTTILNDIYIFGSITESQPKHHYFFPLVTIPRCNSLRCVTLSQIFVAVSWLALSSLTASPRCCLLTGYSPFKPATLEFKKNPALHSNPKFKIRNVLNTHSDVNSGKYSKHRKSAKLP